MATRYFTASEVSVLSVAISVATYGNMTYMTNMTIIVQDAEQVFSAFKFERGERHEETKRLQSALWYWVFRRYPLWFLWLRMGI